MRQWTHVSSWKGKVLIREVRDGRRSKRRVAYKPTLYVDCDESRATHRTIYGEPVGEVEVASSWDARDFLRKNAGRVHGFTHWEYQLLAREYPGVVDFDPRAVRIAYLDIEVMADDGFSTPEEASKEVTLITFKVGEKIAMFGCRPYEPADPRVVYFLCSDEAELLRKFLAAWNSDKLCPDVLSGWNVEGYDVPYLVNRITRVLGREQAEKLSPWGILDEKTIFSLGRDRTVYVPRGISVLDYQRLFHKLGVMTRACETPDDYKLNTVAHQELGEKKLDYSEYESLHDLYVRDWKKYCDYNLVDVLLVEKLNDKLQLMELVMTMAYDCKCNFEDMLGSVKPWECKIHHELLADGIVFPIREKDPEQLDLVGAYVRESEPGGYDWVVPFDVEGMYPSIISQFNLSPETKALRHDVGTDYDETFLDRARALLPELRRDGVALAANGQTFRTGAKGLIPRILETVADKRSDAKRRMVDAQKRREETGDASLDAEVARYKVLQLGLKVLRNSCYGVITNRYFIFYDHDIAEAITTTGQVVNRLVGARIDEYLNGLMGTSGTNIPGGDTDSVYVCLGPIVQRFMPGKSVDRVLPFVEEVCEKKIQPVIERAMIDLQEATCCPTNYLRMSQEKICDRIIWTKKKHYVMSTLVEEGVRYHEPKIKFKGMAAVKSSTPPSCRAKLKDAIKIIMGGTQSEMRAFVEDFRREFETLPFHEIAFPRGVSEIEKWEVSRKSEEERTLWGPGDAASAAGLYKSGTPIQVRGAIVYNLLRRKLGLLDYPEIYSGDKIKYAYLKVPNPYTENVFGTPGPLLPGISSYVDRDVMWEKGFVTPLRTILEAVGWGEALEREQASLEDFFA